MEAFITLIFILGLYFLPTIVAFTNNRCPNKVGVFLLNFLLGVTFIGWIIALVMACNTSGAQINIVNNNVDSTKSKQQHTK